MKGLELKEIDPYLSNDTRDLREVQKTIQDYKPKLMDVSMTMKLLNWVIELILKIFPDLEKEILDLKKRNPKSKEENQSYWKFQNTPRASKRCF